MITSPSEEQDELRRMVRRFLADRSGETDVRTAMATDSGYDASTWKTMAEQLGLQGIAVPEPYGGRYSKRNIR